MRGSKKAASGTLLACYTFRTISQRNEASQCLMMARLTTAGDPKYRFQSVPNETEKLVEAMLKGMALAISCRNDCPFTPLAEYQ